MIKHDFQGDNFVTFFLLKFCKYSREIFQRALICGAVNIVIAHNHPSHDTTPSKDDDVAASKISEAGKLMKIQLVDFIIIGNGYFSYAEEKRI